MMRYLALAIDYDGTIAADGVVSELTIEALKAAKSSGRKLILVTGRQLENLIACFPSYELFHIIVAENGALIYEPASKFEQVLCEPSQPLIDLLRKRNVEPLSVGKGIISTWEPNDRAALDAIRELGLELHITFNKGAVMILPAGLNKGRSLMTALARLNLSPHNVVGVGDAENDHAFLNVCEFSVAVANALPSLKEKADWTTTASRGSGVVELVERILQNDLAELSPHRHFVSIGEHPDGSKEEIDPYQTGVLVCGLSGGGKSKTTLGILDRLSKQNYQFCLIDPEGDYESFGNAIVIGDVNRVPSVSEVMQLLDSPDRSVIVNLLGVQLEDRPSFFLTLLAHIQDFRTARGRPHWLVVDEAHHLFPPEWKKTESLSTENLRSILMITVHPERLAPQLLQSVDLLIAVGDQADAAVKVFAKQIGAQCPNFPEVKDLDKGTGFSWFVHGSRDASIIKLERSDIDKVRHRRKYAQGELGEDRSFYFRGPESKLNLRVQNLALFSQIARGIDDDTWLFHLANHDYSGWFRQAIKDDELADYAQMVESQKNISPQESKKLISKAIEERYTLPA